MWRVCVLDRLSYTKNVRYYETPISGISLGKRWWWEGSGIEKEEVGIAGAHNLFTHTHTDKFKGGIVDENTSDNETALA